MRARNNDLISNGRRTKVNQTHPNAIDLTSDRGMMISLKNSTNLRKGSFFVDVGKLRGDDDDPIFLVLQGVDLPPLHGTSGDDLPGLVQW
jgi:hypothetical protein